MCIQRSPVTNFYFCVECISIADGPYEVFTVIPSLTPRIPDGENAEMGSVPDKPKPAVTAAVDLRNVLRLVMMKKG